MRARRVLAVAWRDLRLVHAGKAWFRLPMLALGLLLPAGALPLRFEARAPVVASAAGEIPAALREQIASDPASKVHLSGQAPVVVAAASVPTRLREALDTLPGPAVELVRPSRRRPLPGRSLIVALLAISLLTGPLAESLPGERGAGTLEVLLSASLTRAELVVGKWLAWTLYGSGLAGVAALGGILSGTQTVGLWPLALPLVVGVSVALGLWLVRGAVDVVSGAAVPMRVLPAVAAATSGVAWGLGGSSALLGAAVPLGGALLVASGALTGPGALGAAALASALTIAGLLRGAALAIDQGGVARAGRGKAWALAGFGVGVHWLAVAGPGLWAVAGNPNLVLPLGASLASGGVCAALIAGVWWARGEGDGPRWGDRAGLLWGAVVGLALGLIAQYSMNVIAPVQGALWMDPLRERLLRSPVEGGALAALAAVIGQGLLYRGVLLAALGPVGSAVAWAIAVHPFDPVRGLAGGLVLALVARRWGLLPALLAHALLVGLGG